MTDPDKIPQFPTAPRTVRKVKATQVAIVDLSGKRLSREVSVFLSTAGSPAFWVGVPAEYRNAWANHRCTEYGDQYGPNERLRVQGEFIVMLTFDACIDGLQRMSENYRKHIESITVEKVICLDLELSAPNVVPVVHHNKNSFSKVRTMAGMRADVRWAVNGKLYQDGRHHWHHDDRADGTLPSEPTYEELVPCERYSGFQIPYTDAAWATLVTIEATLTRAAVMLNGLADKTQTLALLEGGMPALLGAPKLVG